MEYPTLLELPGPRLLAYPRETVISEKLEAMVKLGIANSRMKDFHDLHSLATTFEFDGKTLTEAVRATFKRRGTELPAGGVPLAFTPEFYEDEKQDQTVERFLQQEQIVRSGSEVRRRCRSPRIVPRPCHQVSATGESPGQRVDARPRVALLSFAKIQNGKKSATDLGFASFVTRIVWIMMNASSNGRDSLARQFSPARNARTSYAYI
jgi:hypothetical protein